MIRLESKRFFTRTLFKTKRKTNFLADKFSNLLSLKVKPGGKIPIFMKLAKILTNTRSENNTVEDEIVALFIFFDRTRGNL